MTNATVRPLLVVTGDGTPTEVPPMMGAYLWASDDVADGNPKKLGQVRAAYVDSQNELDEIRPDVVIVHGSPSQLLVLGPDGQPALAWVVRQLRQQLPTVRVWVGVGCDGTVDEWRAGTASALQVQAPLLAVARLCHALGVEAVVWNAETGWKHSPKDKRTKAELEALATTVLDAVCASAPRVVHMLSSFDHVGFHMAMPWEGLTGGNAAAFTTQNYVARPGDPPSGLLAGRIASAARSIDAARRQDKFRPDSAGADGADDSHDDLDVLSTVQLHKTDSTDLCCALAEHDHIIAWSLPLVEREHGRADREGVMAAAAAMTIRREVGAGRGAVRRYQLARGLTADGRPGPLTRADTRAPRVCPPSRA